MERTMENLSVMLPSLGRRPLGHKIPFTVSGLKEAGVTPCTFLRSNVSVWLGAPASRIKITFLAVFFVCPPELVTVAALAYRCARYDPVMPAPASWKN